jgi:hypothetical protein
MVYTLPKERLQVVKDGPPTVVGYAKSEDNPVLDAVKEAAKDREWRSYKGLKVGDTVKVEKPGPTEKKVVSEVFVTMRMLRRAVKHLGLGLDTRRQPGEAKGTIDLYWRVRPKLGTTETAAAE